jgi:hypothetical protein
MSTVSAAFLKLPAWARLRYPEATHAVNWINELLQEISSLPGVFKELKKETGTPVTSDIWLTKPSDLRTVISITDSVSGASYSWDEVNDALQLTDGEIVTDATPDTATAFTSSTVSHINVNITNAVADEYANYLMNITSGSLAGTGIMLSGNDATSAGTCRLYFKKPLAVALSGAAVTAVELLQNYAILRYFSGYTRVASVSDEIPIADKYEDTIVSKWFEYRVFRGVDESLPQAQTAKKEFDNVKWSIKRESRSVMGNKRVQPRRSPGFLLLNSRR